MLAQQEERFALCAGCAVAVVWSALAFGRLNVAVVGATALVAATRGRRARGVRSGTGSFQKAKRAAPRVDARSAVSQPGGSLDLGHICERCFLQGHDCALSLVLVTAALPVTLFGKLETSEARSEPLSLLLPKERTTVLDALRDGDPPFVRASDSAEGEASLAVDASAATAWSGRAGAKSWTWAASFTRPAHLGVIRALWGKAPTIGIPTVFQWEVLAPGPDETCDGTPPSAAGAWTPLSGADQGPAAGAMSPAQPTRRSWFVDASACGVRLVVTSTNAGPPELRDVRAIESARDVLRSGVASDDGASPGSTAADAIDGTYGRRWIGARGHGHWTLRVDLPEPAPLDRVRLVLGLDATSVPRSGAGRTYGIAWGPVHYGLEEPAAKTAFASSASRASRSGPTGPYFHSAAVWCPSTTRDRSAHSAW